MNKSGFWVVVILVLAALVGALLSSCSAEQTSKIKVVTSTSLMAYVAQEVGGDRLQVINLVPPTQHPGDFDVTPSDIQNLAEAKLFLLHGWPGEGYADKLIASANNPDLAVVKADVNGNWMIPSIQMKATDRVADVLGQIDSGNAANYQKSAEEYEKSILSKEADIKSRLNEARVSKVNVIASIRQADFLQWAGFNVVATYNTPDSLTPNTVKDMVDKGRDTKVSLVVNNLQDSADAGKGLAEELGAKNLNLSNFPGGLENTDTWEKAIDKNVELLLEAIGK